MVIVSTCELEWREILYCMAKKSTCVYEDLLVRHHIWYFLSHQSIYYYSHRFFWFHKTKFDTVKWCKNHCKKGRDKNIVKNRHKTFSSLYAHLYELYIVNAPQSKTQIFGVDENYVQTFFKTFSVNSLLHSFRRF